MATFEGWDPCWLGEASKRWSPAKPGTGWTRSPARPRPPDCFMRVVAWRCSGTCPSLLPTWPRRSPPSTAGYFPTRRSSAWRCPACRRTPSCSSGPRARCETVAASPRLSAGSSIGSAPIQGRVAGSGADLRRPQPVPAWQARRTPRGPGSHDRRLRRELHHELRRRGDHGSAHQRGPQRDRLSRHHGSGHPVEEKRVRAGQADREEQAEAIRPWTGHLTGSDRSEGHQVALVRTADQHVRRIVGTHTASGRSSSAAGRWTSGHSTGGWRGRYWPTLPSMRSRIRSAWPQWRAYSSIM